MVGRLKLLVLVTSAALALAAAAVPASANSNDQTLLSATGVKTIVGPFGFWLWSQQGGNAYGNDGAGNIYFYALGIADPADVSNVVISGNTVSEDETSANTECHLYGVESSPGQGTIQFSCTTSQTGATVISGTTSGQVTITGG